MTPLSPNFSLEELLRSQTALRLGIDNTPSDEVIANLREICMSLLEPARRILGCPLHVDSGYRSPALNAAVGGAKDSRHVLGLAADIIPVGVEIHAAFDTLRRNGALPIDQIIGECGFAWIHLGAAPQGAVPRRQALTASGGPGHWTYALVA